MSEQTYYDDKELRAIVLVIEALRGLDEEAIKRVMIYLMNRYKLRFP